jgi:hypothetical protein
MRPDEYYAADAERWTKVLQFRNAIADGKEHARDDAHAKQAQEQLSANARSQR